MSAEQIAAAARLWRQGYDTFAIAKKLFGWVHVPEHARYANQLRGYYL